MVAQSALEREFPSIATSATDTEKLDDSTKRQRELTSARDTWNNGSVLMAWSLSPQSFIDSGASIETLDPNVLGERQSRRLMELAFGLGLSVDGTIKDIVRFLTDAGFNPYIGTLDQMVLFYLDNYWYAP